MSTLQEELTNASQTFSFTLILKLISVLDIEFLYSQDIIMSFQIFLLVSHFTN